jgi:hypothetical protein
MNSSGERVGVGVEVAEPHTQNHSIRQASMTALLDRINQALTVLNLDFTKKDQISYDRIR